MNAVCQVFVKSDFLDNEDVGEFSAALEFPRGGELYHGVGALAAAREKIDRMKATLMNDKITP